MLARRTLVLFALSVATILLAPPVRAQTTPDLRAITPDEFALLHPLFSRGVVVVLRSVDAGPGPCCTVYVRVRAPVDTVRRAIAMPEDYPRFMPALNSVQVVSRRGPRVAFRFSLHAGPFDVEALAALRVVNQRRIDVSVPQSELGPSASRWELFSEPDGSTVAALTMWSDPTRGGWLAQQVARVPGWGSVAVNLPIATALAMGVAQRAEQATGSTRRVRPTQFAAAPAVLSAPPVGPWLHLTLETNILLLTFRPDGALEQIMVAGAAANRGVAPMVQRLLQPEQWHVGWPWMGHPEVLARTDHDVRVRLRLGAPLASSRGTMRGEVREPGHSVQFTGDSGDFAGEQHRWDFVPYDNGTYLIYTAGAEERHAPWPQRSFLGVDPWASAGVLAFWNVVTIRTAFDGVD